MTETWKPIIDEPVRGSIEDGRLYALSGLERVRAMARGLVPEPPLFRLMGLRVTAAGPGQATVAMPASPWLVARSGSIWMHPLIEVAIGMAARTTAAPGESPGQGIVTTNYLRWPSLEAESFMARAAVTAASRRHGVVSVDVEDTFGRVVVTATGQFFLREVDNVGVSSPSIERSSQPMYATPDPPDRPLDGSVEIAGRMGRITSEPASAAMTLDLHRRLLDGVELPSPLVRLTGMRVLEMHEGCAEAALPASPWFAITSRGIHPGMVGHLVLGVGGGASFTAVTSDHRQAWLRAMHYNFMRPITADGRDVLARARVVHADDESLVITTEVIDADGNRCGFGTADAAILDRRSEIGEADPERILTTVLFTDIVSSTERTASAGDARWKQILDGHLAVVRRQLQVFRGREVNTTGDGIIATFDSPARAVQCARAITDGARHAHLEIRAGVHLGECELYGADLTGIAVVIARRVCDTGSAGEILVTSTVREASAGSGLRFTDRGMHQLKGVPDEWRLFAVES